MDHKPRRREKHVTSGGGNVYRRDEYNGSSGGSTRGSGGSKMPLLLVILALLFGGGGGLAGLFGGSGDSGYTNPTVSDGWSTSESSTQTETIDETTASGSRSKFTTIKGSGKDVVNLMIYMCGTDLESRSGMATSDLNEIAKGASGEKVNILIYTGGTRRWKNNLIDNSKNQIYQVVDGKFAKLVSNDGTSSMTDPATLTRFLQYCKKNFPANRNQLIFWDHGGGSVSGYGYDEKNVRSGAMSLGEIKKALKSTGMKFDFIGFDACLMGTLENGLMLSDFADYLIASEETEPGVGWYYTNWVNDLCKNSSLPTTQIGKRIVDDFVSTCAKRTPGQSTTLSLVDLAELSNTVPKKLASFSQSLTSLMKSNNYQKVSKARNSSRSFARGQKIDQIDLIHFASQIGNSESKSLISALQGAIKYNKTSRNMTNAYGLAIYFPYESVAKVDTMVNTYSDIGISDEYSRCIQNFASTEAVGQASYGGSSSSYQSILQALGQSTSQQTTSSSDIETLINLFLGGRYNAVDGLDKSNTKFLKEQALSSQDLKKYVQDTYFDESALTWVEENGTKKIKLSNKQWSLVQDLDQSMFYDDGKGYICLGLDNVYDLDKKGNLLAVSDRTWLAINGQVVPYYHLSTVERSEDDYTITGRVPCLVNDVYMNLILVFDTDHPYGYIAGATTDYREGETETLAKNLIALNKGDKLDFICEYYTYQGKYNSRYKMGNRITVTNNMQISNVNVGKGKLKIAYRFTDIYNQAHYSDGFDA
ncbi:MAG: clostripain-related cysteine peptidase [bacterium]